MNIKQFSKKLNEHGATYKQWRRNVLLHALKNSWGGSDTSDPEFVFNDPDNSWDTLTSGYFNWAQTPEGYDFWYNVNVEKKASH